MSQTTYYELNKPTGSDLVNLLTDTFPNWDIVDNALHELDTRSIANATEVVSLGVHAISRLNTNTKFIKWIATANFTAGDTFTVDGDVVAASTPGGATLGTNAYVTGAVVVACLNADDSAMTVYVTGVAVADDANKLGGELPAYYATQSDMSDAQTDIGNIKALDGTTSIVGIGDGTLTGAISALNNDLTDIHNVVRINDTYTFGAGVVLIRYDETKYRAFGITCDENYIERYKIWIDSTQTVGNRGVIQAVITDYAGTVISSGTPITCATYYYEL